MVAAGPLREDRRDEFLAFVRQAINDLGASDPELLCVVLPYREHITGNDDFGALRLNLERMREREVGGGIQGDS
jgi:hypothetical protein